MGTVKDLKPFKNTPIPITEGLINGRELQLFMMVETVGEY